LAVVRQLAKPNISSNLNLITDKGNIYSFTLQDISSLGGDPDLKVIIQPADRSSLTASTGPAQYVPAAQLAQTRDQLTALQSHVTQAVDEYKSAYPLSLKFDYSYPHSYPQDSRARGELPRTSSNQIAA
jgi:hypothetical protein